MKKIYFLFLFSFMFLFLSSVSAQTPQGGPSSESIAPVELDPHLLAAPSFFDKVPKIAEGEDAPDQELINKLRQIDLPVIPNDKSIVLLKTAEQNNEALKKGEKPLTSFIYEWNRGTGPLENGSIPPDPNLAVGPAHVIVAVNTMINIYSSSNFSLLSSNTLNNWFGRPTVKMFDPKIIYDPWAGRWIILVLERTATESNYLLSVSQTSDPTGRWWVYRLAANVDGSNTTSNWADYPGLGFSYPIGGTGNTGCIAITSNQFNRATPRNQFQYGKVRLLRASQLYAGAPVNWYDFWNLTFTNQPARQLSSTTNGRIFLIHTNHAGGNSVNVYRVDNPTSSNPSFQNHANIGVTSYSVPPPARQLGGVGLLDALNCMAQDVWLLTDHLYTAWTSAYNYGSGNKAIVHYARLNIANNSLASELRLGNDGEWLMQPSACPEFKAPFNQGKAAISFTRSSPSIYAQGCSIGHDGAAPTNFIAINSTGYYNQSTTVCDTVRWGDYSGVAPDPAQNGVFWSVSETVNPGQWSTGVLKFSYSPKPTLVVTSPNGGETWHIGATKNIIWTTDGITNVKIEYSTNNGADWITIIGSAYAPYGFFGWRVPNTPSTQCKIRVSDAGGTDIRDESNNVFTIAHPPSLTVLSPNGGETWYAGTTRSIRWSSVNVGNIRMEYSTNGGMWWLPVATLIPASDGVYTWNVPNTPSTRCKVRIYDPNNEFTIYDQSNHDFTISNEQHLVLRYPNGLERWAVGSLHDIVWDRGSTTSLMINYSTDAGKTWLQVASNVDAALGSYPWIIPNTPSDHCLVEVYDANNSSYRDMSNSTFSIVNNPFITVLTPNGGERWFVNYKQTITWRSEGLKSVKIEYCTDGGKNWITIQESVAANADLISLTVPNTPGQSCFVRISSASDPSIFDISDFSFVISGDSPLAIISPRPIGYVLGLGNSSTARYQLGNAGNTVLNYKIITSYLKGPNLPDGEEQIKQIKQKSKETIIPNENVNASSTEITPARREGMIKEKTNTKTGLNTAKPNYTRKAIILKSWGYTPVWDELQTNWSNYGTMALEIDYNTFMYAESFTLQDLINSNADVVILSDPAGANKQFSREEADALIAYAAMGHNIVGTYAVFQHSFTDNRHLAPLFGLTSGFTYNVQEISPEFEIYSSQNQVFNSIYSPYISGGFNSSQVPYSWDTSNYQGAVCVARTSDKKGVVTLFNTNAFSSIYISHMPEYYGNNADAMLLYNAITYTNVFANWLFPFPMEGQILPSSSAEIEFQAQTANMPEGDYEANVFLTTDDPGNPSISIPVTMSVRAPAKPAPTNLVAGNSFAGMIPLTWSAPEGTVWVGSTTGNDANNGDKINNKKKPADTHADTISLYRVYFAVSGGGPYILLSEHSAALNGFVNNQNYIDTPMDTITSRYYVVSAVYKDGTESGYSNEVFATTSWEGQRKFLNYAVNTPQIDGVINQQEWSDAIKSDINIPGVQTPIKLYLKNSSTKLYIALDDPSNITMNDYNAFSVYTDFDNNNMWPTVPTNNEGCYYATFSGGSTRNFFQYVSGVYPFNVFLGAYTENPAGLTSLVSFESGHYTQEMTLDITPISAANLLKGGNISDIIGLWFAYYDQSTRSEIYYGGSGYYPYGTVWQAPISFGKFILAKPNSNNMIIKIDSVSGGGNSEVLVPVRGKNLSNLGAITLRINYNEALLEFVDSLNLNPLLAGALIGKSNGVISIVWDNTIGVNLPDDKIVDLRFINKSGDTGAPLMFLTAECEVADIYMNKLNIEYINGAVLPGLTFTGKVTYANSVNTILAGAKVYMKDGSEVILDSTVTDNSGNFIFTGKTGGFYIFTATTTKPWGGVNSTDALAIRKHMAGGPYLIGYPLFAGDVNGSTDVNSTDALLIRKRLAYQISSFPAGDWYFGNTLVSTIASMTLELKGICMGDVNGSYLPAVAKAENVLAYSNNSSIKVDLGKEFSIPVSLNKECTVNAIYFVLDYPENLLDFKGINTKAEGALYSASNGSIYFAWDDLNSLRVNSNDPVINLKFKFKNGVRLERPVYITLEPQSEIADLNGKIKDNLVIMIPAIGINVPDKYELSQNYPNPFNPVTNIKYSLPYESNVTITVYNMLGQTVEYLVKNIVLPAGYHNVQFNAAKLSSGIYFYNIDAKSIDGIKQFHSVRKSVLVK